MLRRKPFTAGVRCITLASAALLMAGYWLRTDIEKELIDNFATSQGLVSSLLVAGGTLLLLTGLPGIFAPAGRAHRQKRAPSFRAFVYGPGQPFIWAHWRCILYCRYW